MKKVEKQLIDDGRFDVLLSDWIDNPLARGSKTLTLRPSHLLKKLEAFVIVVQFILMESSFLQRCRTVL